MPDNKLQWDQDYFLVPRSLIRYKWAYYSNTKHHNMSMLVFILMVISYFSKLKFKSQVGLIALM